MKKFIIALAVLFAAVSANAQIGIIGGLTSSKTDLKTAIGDVNNINQYHIGLTYKIGVGNLLAIQPSLIYNMKGSKVSDAIAGAAEVDYKTGFLELPVQVQAGFGIGDIIRIYGIAEPFVGFAITNQAITKVGDIKTDPKQTWDNVKNKMEYGIGLGAGVEVFKHLQVSARYFWNLGSIYDFDVEVAKTSVANGTCNGIVASVAFLF